MSHQTALVFPNSISYNARAQSKGNATGASKSLRSISAQSSQKSSSSQASRHHHNSNALNQYDNKNIHTLHHGSNNLLFNPRKLSQNPQLPNLTELKNLRPKSFSLSKTASQGQPAPPVTATAEVVSESIIYPSLYFAKTSLRSLLKEIKFPKDVRSLPPDDPRLPLIFNVVQKLFREISFFAFNILVCIHQITDNYFIFFSDAETVPFSKCCNSPAYVELSGSGSGKITCNGSTCNSKLLTEFTINFDEEQALQDQQKSSYLGKENLVFPRKSENQPFVRRNVSKWITTGFFRHKSITRQLRKQLSTAPCQGGSKETPAVGPQTHTDWNADIMENEEQERNNNKQLAYTSFANSSHNPPHFYSTSYNAEISELKPKRRSITRDNQDYSNNPNHSNNQSILEKRLNWRDVSFMNKQIVEQLVNRSVVFNKPFNFDSHTDVQYPQKVLDLNTQENDLFKEITDNTQQQSVNNPNNMDFPQRQSKSFASSHHPMKLQQSQQLRQQKQNILAIKNMVQNVLQRQPEYPDHTEVPFSNQALQRY